MCSSDLGLVVVCGGRRGPSFVGSGCRMGVGNVVLGQWALFGGGVTLFGAVGIVWRQGTSFGGGGSCLWVGGVCRSCSFPCSHCGHCCCYGCCCGVVVVGVLVGVVVVGVVVVVVVVGISVGRCDTVVVVVVVEEVVMVVMCHI